MTCEEDMGFKCRICGMSIGEGESMWSVNVHREVLDGGAITVQEADCYWVFCNACGQKRDFLHMTIPLRVEDSEHNS